MFSDTDILCFANDWSADPTSKHQLIGRFSAVNRVLWVESAGMRTPNLARAGDLRRLARKGRAFLRHARPVGDRLFAYAPPALPFPHRRSASTVNALLYEYTLGREMRRAGMETSPLIWAFVPHVAPLIRRIPRAGLVYYCVDRWSAFEGYNATFMAEAEAELCAQADVVFASAQDLAERCAAHSDNVHYMPHGVDHAHFAAALVDGPIPEDVRALPGPRIGFFGLLHEWVDLELIGKLADQLPYTFVLIGATDRDLTPLTRRRNVVHLGRKPYSELPAYCRAFDAAIVPFRCTTLTHSVNPIKLREYAAAGLPIVSTDLPEVRRCIDIAVTATTVDEWANALHAAVARGGSPVHRADQSRKVLKDDWSAVCERVSALILESVVARPARERYARIPRAVAPGAPRHFVRPT